MELRENNKTETMNCLKRTLLIAKVGVICTKN